MSDEKQDRRRGDRVALSVGLTTADPRATTAVSDLSESGVFVHTGNPLPVGAYIELRFSVFPEQPILFEATGVVKRHAQEPSGMGVEFAPLSDSARDVVKKILLRHEADRARRGVAHETDVLRTHELVARMVTKG